MLLLLFGSLTGQQSLPGIDGISRFEIVEVAEFFNTELIRQADSVKVLPIFDHMMAVGSSFLFKGDLWLNMYLGFRGLRKGDDRGRLHGCGRNWR